MKKIYWIFIILALVVSIWVIYYKTDFFQNLGLKIPRNYEDCQNFGGKITTEMTPVKTRFTCIYKNKQFEITRFE